VSRDAMIFVSAILPHVGVTVTRTAAHRHVPGLFLSSASCHF